MNKLEGLYAISPETDNSDDLIARVSLVLDNGARILQYRNKSDNTVRRLRQASLLSSLCKSRRVTFIVNDDIPLARAVEADGVHLGRDDAGIAEARRVLGSEAVIGVSCYNDIDRARIAHQAGASYVAFGAVFPSSTKPHAPRAPLELFARTRQWGIPAVAIGGITVDNARSVVEAGADAIAVIGGLFDVADPAAAARAFAGLFPA
ncbi:thiamine phosphate synthase [uncultured Aquitalea sp.]|uniref:thiamine phosphate synthase n=1 Tax=uncultured Aquitalea sp. TaxID=540272 RepID=UPI0025D6EF0D|nr:thiamine phosphate synthase [uncultured Aquitalea sp.]